MIRAVLVALSLSLLACGDVGAVDVSGELSRWGEDAAGHFLPLTDSTYDLGSIGKRARKIWGMELYLPSDLANGRLNLRDYTTGNPSIQMGFCVFNGAATATCTKSVAYNDSLSYVCTATKYNAVTAVGVTNTSGTVVTVTSGLANDVGTVGLVCVGN
jgi:hypothetical protein